jgi:hypothetical protein
MHFLKEGSSGDMILSICQHGQEKINIYIQARRGGALSDLMNDSVSVFTWCQLWE